MYAFIEGEIIDKNEHCVVIRPDGVGLGLKVHVPERTSADLPPSGGTARLHTSFQVREDSQTLYGFESAPERDLFEALLKISGIGGKTALAILDLPRNRIVEAIAAGDSGVLTQVQGVGAKTAGRIVLELKDRFAEELITEWGRAAVADISAGYYADMTEGGTGRGFAEAVEALVELGYHRGEAREQVRRARGTLGDEAAAEDLVRHVLQHVG
jgi:Holliday junction DNA helicase RuvA